MLSNPATIDIVGHDEQRHKLLLVMTEERPWNTVNKFEVLAKVATYRNYALSEQLANENPGFTARDVVLKIVCNFPPSPKALELFEKLRMELREANLELEWEVLTLAEDVEVPHALASSMPRQEFQTLETWFFRCSRIDKPGKQGAQQLLDILHSSGGRFLWPNESEDTDVPLWQVNPDPGEDIAEDGAFSISDFSHPLLGRSLFEPTPLRDFPPTCTVSYWPGFQLMHVSQSGSSAKSKNLNELAEGQLELARSLFPHLQPALAFIDEQAGIEENAFHRLLEDYVARIDLPYLCWANLFGPAYVQKFGADFFLNAPGCRKEHLPGAGILHVTTSRFYTWWKEPAAEILAYFRQAFPKVEFFQAGPTELKFPE